MSRSKLERKYHCWNDCLMSGCPGHTATLEFQSVSDAFHFNDGKGNDFYGQTPEYGTLLSMIAELAGWRIEAESMIKDAGMSIHPNPVTNIREKEES